MTGQYPNQSISIAMMISEVAYKVVIGVEGFILFVFRTNK